MPLATAALDARAARRVAAAAIAAALQGVFYWLILHEAVGPTALPAAAPLEVTILQTVRRLKPALLSRKRRRPPRQVGQRREFPPQAEATEPTTLPRAVKPAPHPRADWSRAIPAEVRAEESGSRAGKFRFGFPRQSAPVPAAPEFGWDYAATHRLVPLPRGGILLSLNDHCALVIYGFIFLPGCRIGRIPANGELFDHMHDRRDEGSGSLP